MLSGRAAGFPGLTRDCGTLPKVNRGAIAVGARLFTMPMIRPANTGGRMRVLLVEDEPLIAGFVAKGLREAGHSVAAIEALLHEVSI